MLEDPSCYSKKFGHIMLGKASDKLCQQVKDVLNICFKQAYCSKPGEKKWARQQGLWRVIPVCLGSLKTNISLS